MENFQNTQESPPASKRKNIFFPVLIGVSFLLISYFLSYAIPILFPIVLALLSFFSLIVLIRGIKRFKSTKGKLLKFIINIIIPLIFFIIFAILSYLSVAIHIILSDYNF